MALPAAQKLASAFYPATQHTPLSIKDVSHSSRPTSSSPLRAPYLPTDPPNILYYPDNMPAAPDLPLLSPNFDPTNPPKTTSSPTRRRFLRSSIRNHCKFTTTPPTPGAYASSNSNIKTHQASLHTYPLPSAGPPFCLLFCRSRGQRPAREEIRQAGEEKAVVDCVWSAGAA